MQNRVKTTPIELLERSKRVLDLFVQQTENDLLKFYTPNEFDEYPETEHYTPLDGSLVDKVTRWTPLNKDHAKEIYTQYDSEFRPFKSLGKQHQANLLKAFYLNHLKPIFNSNNNEYYKNYAFSFFSESANDMLESHQAFEKVLIELERDINHFIDQENQNQPSNR